MSLAEILGKHKSYNNETTAKIAKLHDAISTRFPNVVKPRLVWNRALQSRLGQYRGHFCGKDVEIELCYTDDVDRLVETLIHEWAHHLQYSVAHSRGHDINFWSIYGQLLVTFTGAFHLERPVPSRLAYAAVAEKLQP